MDTRFPVTWTVKLVRETLVDAAWHCIRSGGPAMPGVAFMGVWDTSTPPDDDERDRKLRLRPSPARVSFLERAIRWPVDYLRDSPDEARMLQLWIRCKVTRLNFQDEAGDFGVSRATAYRMRDRALTLVSVGLDRDGVPLWGE